MRRVFKFDFVSASFILNASGVETKSLSHSARRLPTDYYAIRMLYNLNRTLGIVCPITKLDLVLSMITRRAKR
ncbi:hypothetical protein EJ04DRAFT_166486 [Polyplosphaeria fusca]|uniref:Uncharacterized protein n=1 Tax=Polyplosphaeria fusca TaxID=682080 RepID=A0A9P4R865_9PLEO|nr:hypothetical protein EJ04DRAFT_166486 [Polyplosphaeria fusca]